MTDTLRAKLRQSFEKYAQYPEAWKVWAEDVEQAFQEAGYINLKQSGIPEDIAYGLGFMTGQEFYERFEKELFEQRFEVISGHVLYYEDEVLAAAKHAAGLEGAEQ